MTTTPDAPAIETRDVVKVYGHGEGAVRALDGVSVRLPVGEFVAIMGPSGSGKSTLMHCMAGLDRVSEGTVHLGGLDLTAASEAELTRIRRDQIGFIFQAFNLLPTLTALENITLPLELAGRRADPTVLDGLVDSLGLRDRLTHLPAELSGGQQQRVAVARALVTGPAVIFADEPTGALDSTAGEQLLDYLRRCSTEQGQTIVMVTHDPAAASYASRIVTLSDGRIVSDQASDAVAQPRHAALG